MSPTFLTNRQRPATSFVACTYEISHADTTPVDELAGLAAAELDQGDFTAAERLLREGLEQDPGHPACRAWLAVCLAAMGRADGSPEELAREVVRDRPDDPTGWFALGQVQLLGGKRGAAFQHFAQARELTGRRDEIRRRVARQDPRGASVFARLPRDHPLNVLAGRLRSRLARWFGKR